MSTDPISGTWTALFSPDRRAYLERLAKDTFGYFRDLTNPENGLVPDNTRPGAPCSIAATGLGLACWRWALDGGSTVTLTPWAVVASLSFAPDIVLPTIECIDDRYPGMISEYGFRCSFNATYRASPGGTAGSPGATMGSTRARSS